MSGHPLTAERPGRQIDTPLPTVLSGELPNNKDVKIGGIISSVERRVDRNSAPWSSPPWKTSTARRWNCSFAKTYQMVAPQIVEDNIVLAKAKIRYRDDRMSIFCEDLKSAELSIGAGTGVPLRLNIRVDQATPENMQRLKQVLSNNKGDSDVYLTLIDGEQEVQFLLGPEMRVTKSPALMGDLKASTWEGIFA